MAAKRQTKKKSSPTKKKAAAKRVAKKASAKPAKKPAKKKAAKKKPAKKASKRASTRHASTPQSPGRVEEIQRIIDVMVSAGAVEVEMEEASGAKLRVRLKEDQPTILTQAMPQQAMPQLPAATGAAPAPAAPSAPAPAVEAAPVVEEGEVVTSPMVGTFYRAASPEAEPFANTGDLVGEDATLCIIEAMKVMNEIKAEISGRIVAILVENGEPVEFGQPLFRIQRG